MVRKSFFRKQGILDKFITESHARTVVVVATGAASSYHLRLRGDLSISCDIVYQKRQEAYNPPAFNLFLNIHSPETSIRCAFINFASQVHKKSDYTTNVFSLSYTTRAVTLATALFTCSSSLTRPPPTSVAIAPGATAFTLIPRLQSLSQGTW